MRVRCLELLRPSLLVSLFACLSVLTVAPRARALDKQGSAHGGASTTSGGKEEDDGFNVSGSAMLGVSIYNPSYAARPDNSGITLFRYAAHADIDLIGQKLSIPIDVNMFTDRERPGAAVFQPSEGDVIAGVTSTWDALRGKVEIGARVEHDRPLDRDGVAQTYADVRGRYLYSLRSIWPQIGHALGDGDISGWFTLGWFAINGSYFARPDNTGIAFLRYAWHYELSILHDHVSFGVDATFFTDRHAPDPIAPTELDFTPEIILRKVPYELHLAFERDHPVGNSGLTQQFLYALVAVEFDLVHVRPPPVEERTHIISP
jgi:hypothetical protein